jgi:hypothetical protein
MGYEEGEEKAPRTVKKLLEAYEHAPGSQLPTAKDTTWGLVNAVTYFADHARVARSTSNRLDSAWFGNSAALKIKAMDMATKIAEAA